MAITPEILRGLIWRNKLRSIVAAGMGGLAWLGGFVVLAAVAGPFGPGWMVPFAVVCLIGGLAAMVLPVYLLNRRYAPRCAKCRMYLYTEEIVDAGVCPRCKASLFG